MPVSIYEKGATLLELLIAVVMVTVAVVILTLTFPKASSTITNSRQHQLATNFASTGIQQLKEQPYALIQVTDPTAGTPFPVSGTANPGGCDCSKEDFSGLPPDAIYTESGVTYTRKVCVNLVDRPGGVWTSYCSDNTSATDKGLKNIRVRVTWAIGADTHFTEMESMVTRQ